MWKGGEGRETVQKGHDKVNPLSLSQLWKGDGEEGGVTPRPFQGQKERVPFRYHLQLFERLQAPGCSLLSLSL